MKLSFAISMQETSFEAIAKGSWRDNLALMRDLGFDGVELAIKDPSLVDPDELHSILDKYGLGLSAIGTGQAYLDEGLSLTDADQSVRSAAIGRLKRHVDLASGFGSIVVIGLLRGSLGKPGSGRDLRFSYFMDSMAAAADYASTKGDVKIAIEPLNRYECDFLHRHDEVAGFIAQTGRRNIKVLLDTFHMNIEEKDITEAFISSKDILGHVHFADSNRRHPGEGHLDFRAIVRTLLKIGYDGYVSGEMLPYPDIQTAMSNHIKYIRGIINEQI